MKNISMMLAMALAMAGTGCGGAESDAAKAFGALIGDQQGGLRQALRESKVRAQRLREEAEQVARNYAVTRDMNVARAMMPRDSEFDWTVGGSSCTGSASSFECNFTFDSHTASCGGEEYTFDNGTLGISMEIATSGTEITITIDINIDGDFKGGDFDEFVDIDCDFAFEMTIDTSDDSFSGSADIGSCGGFSCKVDGEEIDCEDMEDAFAEESC
ncbi:MAG: hypothetical protein IT285_15520 [Bdellovibrionales bacterium]|nr:hypothetical protein [Bdellovibrionales bacterium]